MRHFGLREENAYCVLKDEKPVQTVQAVHRFTLEWTPSVWTDFGAEFRMPSGEKKGVVDERAEEVFGGIQA
jgi:hypothetical protein